MNKEELFSLLNELAEEDVFRVEDMSNHPCNKAIIAISKCFEDIEMLRSHLKGHGSATNKLQKLITMPYNPEW